MIKATLRTKKEAPAIPVKAEVVASEKIESTAGIGNGSGTPEDLTGLLPDQTPGNPTEEGGATSSAVATIPRNENRMKAYQPASVEGFEGDWDSSDVKFPQLKLVQGSGPLSQQYDVGTLIFGEAELFAPPSVKEGAVNPSLRFVPISLTKQWREKLTQDQIAEGLMPRIVATMDEVHELGGTTTWGGASTVPDNYWEPSARCVLLLERPEGTDHPGFALELDGKLYGIAVYYAAGSAYRDSAKVIYNTASTQLLSAVLDAEGKPVTNNGRPVKKPFLAKNFWKLSFGKKSSPKSSFTWWGPTVKLIKEETGPELRSYCDGLTKNTEAQSAGAPAE